MFVIDSSVLIDVLAGNQNRQTEVRHRLENLELTAPSLVDCEVAHVLRRAVSAGKLTEARANTALRVLIALPIERFHHTLFLPRIWQLRHNVTAYDAAYVALAETLGVTLLTVDGRLANANRIACPVEIV